MSNPVFQAKQPTTLLAGTYGHPVHAAVVAVPIGSWVGSVVLDVLSRFVNDSAGISRAAWWLLAVGVIGALVAGMAGFLDLMSIPTGTRVWRIGLLHLTCTLGATCIFVLAWLLRRSDPGPAAGTAIGYLVLSLAGLVVLTAGGYFGGELAFRYGVRVAAESDQLAGYTPSPPRDGTRRDAGATPDLAGPAGTDDPSSSDQHDTPPSSH